MNTSDSFGCDTVVSTTHTVNSQVVVATKMCDQLNWVYRSNPSYVNMNLIKERYSLDFDSMTGEEILYQVAQKNYKGNMISAADKLLGDFRKNLLGFGSLESPEDGLERKRAVLRNDGHELKLQSASDASGT